MLRISALAAALLASAPCLAAGPTFEIIDNPRDPTFNQALAISDSGVIAGYFGSGVAGHPNSAYYITPPYTAFTSANVPGATQTQITGFNGASLVGFWSGTNNGAGLDANYGFLRRRAGGTGDNEYLLVNGFTTSSPPTEQLLGVNASLNAAGFYNDANGVSHGFVYVAQTAAYTPIRVAGAKSLVATSINASNLVAGYFQNAAGTTRAFLAPLSGGSPILFSIPGAAVTQFLGVNDEGVAVGFYQMSPSEITHGLTYNPANGEWVTVDDPNGVLGTVLNGLNNKHQAVGFFTDAADNVHGFLANSAF